MSKGAIEEMIARNAEIDIANSLFADLGVNSGSLKTEPDYVNFGKKVG